MAIGTGGNGKSVFARTLQDLMGEYAVTAPGERKDDEKNADRTQERQTLHLNPPTDPTDLFLSSKHNGCQ